jgi:mono/diheme cytochrome c family protein
VAFNRTDEQSHRVGAARVARWLTALVALAASGCDLPGKPDPEQRPKGEHEVVEFEPLFATHCAGCHGAGGKLGPAPPLNDPLFLAIVPDDALLSVISQGRKGTPMPAFAHEHGGKLSEKQIQALARGLKQHWSSDKHLPASIPSYLPSSQAPTTRVDPQRAAGVFAAACAPCHGDHGEGTDGAGPIHDRAFLELISDQALRRLVITGRSDLGMPDFADSTGRDDGFKPLNEQDVEHLVALLAAWRRGEAVDEH